MAQEIKADVKLNLEGLLCPIPVVEEKDRLIALDAQLWSNTVWLYVQASTVQQPKNL